MRITPNYIFQYCKTSMFKVIFRDNVWDFCTVA